MTLIEVGLPVGREPPRRTGSEPEITEATAPLPYAAFNAGLASADIPATMRPGEKAVIHVVVKNLSAHIWPSRGRSDLTYLINVADRWLDAGHGSLVHNQDSRNKLPRDLWPGEEAVVPLTINAPKEPGEYVLEIDLVQEQVTFFKDRDSTPFRVRVRIE
jgi:hypothetical protein